MTLPATAPAAPPLSATAPVSAPAPVAEAPAVQTPQINPNDLAAAIAGSSDPAALLTHVVLAVAARSATAAEQGSLLNTVQARCTQTLRDIRQTLLTSVSEKPGAYEGFTVVQRAGARSVDYDRLLAEHPGIYDDVVKTAAPTLIVRYSN